MSKEPLGDLAERLAQKMTTEVSAPVMEATTITEEAALNASNNPLTNKFRFVWKPEDRAALERIRVSAEGVVEDGFTEVAETLDEFYMQLRVPEQRNGQVLLEADGRPKWKTDDNGRIIEDWSQLTGQDVEQTLAQLAKLRFSLAPKVNSLMLEALMARNSAQDSYDDEWGSLMDGTQGDRTARSNRASRQDKYHAYFKFYIYSTCKVLLDEVNHFDKLLTNIRYWQTRSQQ